MLVLLQSVCIQERIVQAAEKEILTNIFCWFAWFLNVL